MYKTLSEALAKFNGGEEGIRTLKSKKDASSPNWWNNHYPTSPCLKNITSTPACRQAGLSHLSI